MAPRCMQRAALVASFTAVSIRMASSGSISRACGTRSTPLVPGIRMSHSIKATRWRRSACKASSPDPAAYTSNCCCARNFLSAFRMGSSSSTTRIWTGPARSATVVLLTGGWWRSQPSLTFHESDLHRAREQARAVRALQQLAHGTAARRAVVHGVCVHVHAHEPIGARVVEPAAESLRVLERFTPVCETVLDARLQVPRDVPHQRGAQVPAHDVAAQRQRQARLPVPPLA